MLMHGEARAQQRLPFSQGCFYACYSAGGVGSVLGDDVHPSSTSCPMQWRMQDPFWGSKFHILQAPFYRS